ncbi:hypothetical protein [Haliangium sp.]|uniref:hypothetical protein n=1 Tax=Haliangium sp. TaxID=2663208 RepID=UPI003D0E72D8
MSEPSARRDSTAALARALAGAAVAVAVAVAVTMPGCGASTQPDFVATNPSPRPLSARPAAEVKVLDGAPSYDYTEVGLIEALGDDDWDPAAQAAVRAELGRIGAEHGCDAVVIFAEIDWVYVVESSGASNERRGYRGACVVRR